jgi:hypothetical protein
MNVRTMAGLVVLSLASLGTVSVMAHHAFDTEFDAKKPVTLTGVVTKVEWTNPHVWFYLNVKNEKSGEVENWGFEMGGPNGLQREGWSRNTIKIGEVLTVEGFLARNGSRNVNSKNVIVTSTGQKLGAASSIGKTAPELP